MRFCFNLFMLFFSIAVYANEYVVDDKIYNDDTVSKLITVITTTNPIPSIPSTTHIYPTQKSLFRIPAFAKCKKIIVFDGIQSGYENRIADYQQYKCNIYRLTYTDPYFTNTQLVFCKEWGHLSGAITEALKHVTTPYVFIHQHDFILQKDFDLNGVIASMELNPNIKHVRLNRAPWNTYFSDWDGPVDEVIEGGAFVPLCRCCGWSDNDHITRTDYYHNFVLPLCHKEAMEWALHGRLKKAFEDYGYEGHRPFGTYLYGNLNDGDYLYHTDGREVWGR
ncbi:hypothetical protein BN1013_01491 [Candidatus Rubidus massiliensis]|nr:MAG: hypothetical protein BGO10_04840 [Chlamydia sp. 32-24]CDZ80963.1 hypothetical protein BN1013_01491 [Candidatus Rubidus massiliensis]